MRTTLTLEDDVAARLEQLHRRRQVTLKQVVNEALRAGLDHLEHGERKPRRPYRIEAVSLSPKVTDLDNVAEVLAVHEDEAWR